VNAARSREKVEWAPALHESKSLSAISFHAGVQHVQSEHGNALRTKPKKHSWVLAWDRRTFTAQIPWRNDLAFGPIARGWEMQGSPREPADATRHTRPNYLTRGPQLEIVARPRAVIDDYQLLWREAELSGSSGSAGAQASDDDESPFARRVRAYE
jgi:hypothetical protein